MYEARQFHQLAAFWPLLAAASVTESTAAAVRKFVETASGLDGHEDVPEPSWTTPHATKLDLKIVRMHDFSAGGDGPAVLLCAPFALHGAQVADFAPGHSLVAVLQAAGLKRLFLSDWRPAGADMRFLGIDDYLAALNVLVDDLGGQVDLVGLCQGGWMSMAYAARFPAKVRKLVVVGAPIDIAAAPSQISRLVDSTPAALTKEMVELANGRVLGRMVRRLWGAQTPDPESVHRMLGAPEPLESPEFAGLMMRFRAWDSWTTDLPGTYYVEVVERLYRHNELATGEFVALGQKIDLGRIKMPLFLLGAEDDELVAPAQLFAALDLVSTPLQQRKKTLVPGSHLGLFMGKPVLGSVWPKIANWIRASD